jgi:hypothetical protein
VKHKHLALTLGTILTGFLILLFSCKKLNDSTSLGSGLIPPIDNINTFDTTLEVLAFNDTFNILTDTTYYNSGYTHYLGHIENDPFFGKTDGKIYLELKPPNYRYTFLNRPDSLHIDSVVLVLDYTDTYGDTTSLQTVNVYEIPQSSDFGDTSYPIRRSEYPKGQLLGSRTFAPYILNDSIKVYQDTTANQLRIRLDNAFGQRLLDYDTTTASGREDAYSSDSVFRTKVKGFALESTSGNAIMGFNMKGDNTKLAIYYKDDNASSDPAKADTTVAYFSFSLNPTSFSANFIKRDYAGTALEASVNGTTVPDDYVYIQTAPGSFATLKIPGLSGLNNSIVHRAELIMEQVYDVQDTIFPPGNLYVDAYDTTAKNYRTIPYDVSFDFSGNSNVNSFGIAPVISKDPAGNNIRMWRFNLTRYVQHVVNKTEPAYDMRVSAPFYVNELYRVGGFGTISDTVSVSVNNQAARGRVRLGGGNHPTQKMRMRIVYSKI